MSPKKWRPQRMWHYTLRDMCAVKALCSMTITNDWLHQCAPAHHPVIIQSRPRSYSGRSEGWHVNYMDMNNIGCLWARRKCLSQIFTNKCIFVTHSYCYFRVQPCIWWHVYRCQITYGMQIIHATKGISYIISNMKTFGHLCKITYYTNSVK